MLKDLFAKQKRAIETFYDQLDIEPIEQVLEAILACGGTLFLTGIGKSGFIAQKVCATLLSTGTKAAFLPPIDALHGDLGMVEKGDMVLMLSKSGETDELLDLLPFLRGREAQVVAVTSNQESRLANQADLSVALPCEEELCPFDLAPTISTEVQLLFGDVLSMAVMERKGVSLDQYAANHPGGRIGRRLSIKVREMMNAQAPLCAAHKRLEEVLVDFSEKRCGCLIVIDEHKQLKGIFTDGDLRRALQAKGENVLKERLGDLMTPAPKAIDVNSLAWEAMKVMEADPMRPVTVLPVVEQDEVVGVVKMHDLVQANL